MSSTLKSVEIEELLQVPTKNAPAKGKWFFSSLKDTCRLALSEEVEGLWQR